MEQHALEIVLTRITHCKDRNSCSLVCRVFRAAERQSRCHLRLRCTRSSLEQAPTCFPEVCSLDLSTVVPRSVEFKWSPSQLQHLGACFPNVQTLTLFSDGCPDWVNSDDVPFLETWPQLRTIIVQEPEPCVTEYDEMSRAFWPALGGAQVGCRPLILSVKHPGPGIILKEVSLFKVGIAELRAFTEGSSIYLEKLAVELASGMPASHDLDLSSLSLLPSLRELSLESSGCFLSPIQNSSEPFSSLTSLSLRSPMSMTHSLVRNLVTTRVAKRLQILRLDWTPSSEVEPQQNNDLLALHHCKVLEHFELKKGRQLFGNPLLKTILSIIYGAPKLKVLRLYGFQHLKDDELHNCNILIDRLGMRGLLEVDTDFPVTDPDHMPLKGKVQKYGCKLQPSPGSWCLVAGWDTLQDLTLNVELGDMWLTIECPSLRKLKLMMSPRVNQLRFVGPHRSLVEVDLQMRKGDAPRMSKEVAHMVAVIESLQKLGNLTRLSLTASPFSIMRWGTLVTKPIAALQGLEKLVIQMTEALEGVSRMSFVHSLIELLHSKSLVEVQVPFEWDPTLSELYARLYGHY